MFPKFAYAGVENDEAATTARTFCELSCNAVCPLAVFPAAFATTRLTVPPPLTIVVARYLLTAAPGEDLKRIEVAARLLSGADHLAVDAMNSYGPENSAVLASELAQYRLRWLEDICDPLDFETLAAVSSGYPGAIAAGEALFSAAEAKLLDRYGGLRRDRDILLFDPVHCYGIPGYLQIIEHLERRGWPRTAFWPHGGHLFCLHIVAALGLGGAEVNPLCFQPFGGYADDMTVRDSVTRPPETPGIGFEAKHDLRDLFSRLHDT